MKLQHLTIIFVIIMLPISMVITSYIQTQIDTISLQTKYTSRLQTATHDAIKAFQLNTLNNKYSTVSDSKIRDIEASISTFYHSLGVELGASGYDQESLRTFIPALVYTMYDGYYIYGEYYNETIGDYQYGLRPYIYYSCRYKKNNNDFVVNYTLDNTITVYGEINGQYVTKSGALINPNLVDERSIQKIQYQYTDNNGNTHKHEYVVSIQYDDVKIEREILREQLITLNEDNQPSLDTYEYVNYSNRRVYKDIGTDQYFWNNKNKKQYITDEETLNFVKNMTIDNHLYSNSAAQYYADAYEFSKWVNSALQSITQQDAYEADGITKINDFAITTEQEKIFYLTQENNPLLSSSTFNQNRISVIRKAIESNLATAIANFGRMSTYEYEFVVPKFTEEDWDSLVNNITVASFMQGIPIGAKFFNQYCIITNDKNKEVVNADSIYVIEEDNTVHLPICKDMIEQEHTIKEAYQNIDFERQTVVITEGDERYFYPHANAKCYNCIVSVAESYDVDDLLAGSMKTYDANTDTYIVDREATNSIRTSNLRKVYLTALAREKYDLYKTNSYFGN